jgi:hypothetical protein
MPKKKLAVFTIVNNPPMHWLDTWRFYYETIAGISVDDIFMLNHTDGTPQSFDLALAYDNVIKVFNDKCYDHYWLKDVVTHFQEFLLYSYEYVLFAEIDELIIPDPDKFESLTTFINQFDKSNIRCAGYEVQHVKDDERSLRMIWDERDWHKFSFTDRKHWHYSDIYSKILLANHPLKWTIGFHTAINVIAQPSTDLTLVHLKKADFNMLLDLNKQAAAKNWSEYDKRNNHGIQHLITEEKDLREWFNKSAVLLEPIPEKFKKVM